MMENLAKHAGGHEVVPCYELSWAKVQDADVVWFHNVATTAYLNLPLIKLSPIPIWARRKPRPVLIGGVRGHAGYLRSKGILKYFDAIHTGSEELAAISRKHNSHVYVFYPGVDTDLFKPMGPGPQEFTVGWVGDKNKAMKNYHLVERLGYPYRVASKENYIPHEKMPRFYNSLSVYTHFSSHEGGNRTVLEACACGLPVVATDAGAVDRYIDPEWIVPYKNDEDYLVREFKKRLAILEADPELRRSVGEENRRRALKYDWVKVAHEWVKILEETVERSKK